MWVLIHCTTREVLQTTYLSALSSISSQGLREEVQVLLGNLGGWRSEDVPAWCSLKTALSEPHILPGLSCLQTQPLEVLTTFWKGWYSYSQFIGKQTVAQRWESLKCLLQGSFLCTENYTQSVCDTSGQCCVGQISDPTLLVPGQAVLARPY